AESSAGAGTQPAGCGGESNEFEVLTKASKGYALILPNPILNISFKASNIIKFLHCDENTSATDLFSQLLNYFTTFIL
ncbi:MAG: hypothetical protein ABIN36_07070, partial [Ferruginibacter sp.]